MAETRNLSEEIEKTLADLPKSPLDDAGFKKGGRKKYKNIDKIADSISKSLVNGMKQPDGSRRPVTLPQIQNYLNKKGFDSIESFVKSTETAYDIRNPIINGLLLNYGNEIQAFAQALTSGKTYKQAYRDLILSGRLYEMENPMESMTGEIGGGLVTGIRGGLALENQLRKIDTIRKAGTYAPAMATGATEGFVAGYGADDQDFLSSSRLMSALFGMGLGTGTAGGLGMLVSTLGEIKKQGLKSIRKAPPEQGEEAVFDSMVKDELIELDQAGTFGQVTDETTASAENAINKLDEMQGVAGDDFDVVPADLGRNTRRTSEVVINTPSRGANDAVEFLENRQEGQLGRFIDRIEEGSGLVRDNDGMFVDNFVEKTTRESRTFYNQAYQQAQNLDNPIIQKYAQQDWFQEAYREGADLAKLEKLTDPNAPFIPMPKVKIGENGKPLKDSNGKIQYEMVTGPFTLAQLDYVKRGFGDVIDKQVQSSTIGRQRKRLLTKQLVEFVDAVDDAVQKETGGNLYKMARNKFAVGKEAYDAVELGERFSRMPMRRLRALMNKLSDSEKAFFRIGAMESIMDTLERKGQGADISLFFENYPQQRERVRLLFGNDENFKNFMDFVKVERQASLTNRGRFGSRTEPLQEARRQFDQAGDPAILDLAGNVMTLGPNQGIRQSVMNQLRRTSSGINTGSADVASDLLFEPDKTLATQKLRELAKVVPERRKQARRGRARKATIGTGALAPQAGLLGEELYGEYYP